MKYVRYLLNRSLEPIAVAEARHDADRIKAELFSNPTTRRKFLVAGAAVGIAEYLELRRVVANPMLHVGGPPVSTGSITNLSIPGSDYANIPAALVAMNSGDVIQLPAGQTYVHAGVTHSYAEWQNTTSINYGSTAGSGFNSMFLGQSSLYGGAYSTVLPNADYGTIQGPGAGASNGRAVITPPIGILASKYNPGDPEMYFVGSTPVSHFNPGTSGSYLYIDPAYNFSQLAYSSLLFTSVDVAGNGLIITGGSIPAAIPAGTVVSQFLGGTSEAHAIFTPTGGTPGWTFANLELAYALSASGGYSSSLPAIKQGSSLPGLPAVGTMTINNCYIHNCTIGPGEGYGGPGQNGMSTQILNTEITQCGNNNMQTHNIYIGHVGEFILDNSYIHNTTGTWNVKSRAALTILSYNQIRGERSDSNPTAAENSGVDISNGGLCYAIGNIQQLSLKGRNNLLNFNAEGGPFNTAHQASWAAGGPNAIQELYWINGTLIGPSDGVGNRGGPGWGPLHVYGLGATGSIGLGVPQPQFTQLSQSAAGSPSGPVTAARQYWVALTNIGSSGGESFPSTLFAPWGASYVYEYLDISANNVLSVPSVLQTTAANAWNCYANYGDPVIWGNPAAYASTPTPADLTHIWWNQANTLPIFSTTTGATTISITGTIPAGGSQSITTISALTGIGSLSQLVGMAVYAGGTSIDCYVQSVNEATGTLTMNQRYSGTAFTGTITFGWVLWCGFTYATVLGDSGNIAITNNIGLNTTLYGYNPDIAVPGYDGSYTKTPNPFLIGVAVKIPPGNKLTVNAPPSGPSWAPTGVNFWAVPIGYNSGGGITATGMNAPKISNGNMFGISKQTSSPIGYTSNFTTPANTFLHAAQTQPNLFLQNASPIAQGTNFTEPDSGLVNNNPTKAKLKWYRRAGMDDGNGGTADCWYAVVPTGGLSSYTDTIFTDYLNSPAGVVSIWRGCASQIFDANFPGPACNNQVPITVSSAAGNVTALSAIRTNTGTAGSGWLQINTAHPLMNAAYKQSASAFSGLSTTQTGGSASDDIICDMLIGASAAPMLVNSTAFSGTNSSAINFTILSADAGDILYLMIGCTKGANVTGVGSIYAPLQCTATAGSPKLLLQNCILANFNQPQTGGVAVFGDNSLPMPASGYVTTVSCLTANPYNGSAFTTPLWATVFNDPDQADSDYRLASGSPAHGIATGPGTSPYGQNLVPVSYTGWNGIVTPGMPIPNKLARNDISTTPGATAGSAGAIP